MTISFSDNFFKYDMNDGYYPCFSDEGNGKYRIDLQKTEDSSDNILKLSQTINLMGKRIKEMGITNYVQCLMLERNSSFFVSNLLCLSSYSSEKFKPAESRIVLIKKRALEDPLVLESNKRARHNEPSFDVFSLVSSEWNSKIKHINEQCLLLEQAISNAKDGLVILPDASIKKLTIEDVEVILKNMRLLIDTYPTYPEIQNLVGKMNRAWPQMLKHVKSEEQEIVPKLMFQYLQERMAIPTLFCQFAKKLSKEEARRFYGCLLGFKGPNFMNWLFLATVTTFSEKLKSETNLLYYSISRFRYLFVSKDPDFYVKSFISFIDWMLDKIPVQYCKEKVTIYELFARNCMNKFIENNLPIPQGINELYQKIKKLDNGFTSEIFYRELLANLFEVNGKTTLQECEIPLEGVTTYLIEDGFLQLLASLYGKAIRQCIAENHPKILILKRMLQIADDKKYYYAYTQTSIKYEHCSSRVRYREFLFLGNQGFGCGNFPGILVFKIDPNKFKDDHLEEIDVVCEKGEQINKFFNQKPLVEMEAKAIGYIPFPEQTVGNCAPKSVSLSCFALAFLAYGYEQLKTDHFNDVQKAFESECRSLHQELNNSVRNALLQEYEKRHREGSKQPLDEALLTRIKAIK